MDVLERALTPLCQDSWLLYQHLIREQGLTAQDRLPPVFPLVMYNGDSRWTATQELKI